MKKKKTPLRMCVGCREMKPKNELVRVVRETTGQARIDKTGRSNGRGAYLCPAEECLISAKKNRGLERALEIRIDPDFHELLEVYIKEAR